MVLTNFSESFDCIDDVKQGEKLNTIQVINVKKYDRFNIQFRNSSNSIVRFFIKTQDTDLEEIISSTKNIIDKINVKPNDCKSKKFKNNTYSFIKIKVSSADIIESSQVYVHVCGEVK